MLNEGNTMALKVKSDSMNLEFKEGTILIIEKTKYIKSGDLALIEINKIKKVIRKIKMNKETITLIPMSKNSKYIPHTYNIKKDNIKIIGKVKQTMKSY